MDTQLITKLPSFDSILSETAPAKKHEEYHTLMNTEPPAKWVKENKFAGNIRYVPIDKIEYLLDAIFGQWRVEVLSVGSLFNAVYTHIRLHYIDPVTELWTFHDGVGASQIQTSKGASAADLAKINNNAVQMALPASKSYAIKDAADHLGRIFGRDLNRKEVMPFNAEINNAFKTSQAAKLKDKFKKVNQE